MIEYIENIIVKLDGKRVGTIKKVEGGYQYFPKGNNKLFGAIYQSIDDVKNSLK